MRKNLGSLVAVIIVTSSLSVASIITMDPPFWEGNITLVEDTQKIVVAGSEHTHYTISGTSALAALDEASSVGGFGYTINDEWYDQYGSLLVDSIAGYEGDAMNGWQYWVNYPEDSLPWMSADKYELEDGDVIDWYYGSYGTTPDSSSVSIVIQVAIVEDITPPTVNILKPSEGGVYFFDREIFSVPGENAFVFGGLTVEAVVSDDLTEIALVELYIDDMLRYSSMNSSCTWVWEDKTIGVHTITVKGFDQSDNHQNMERIIFMIYF